MKKASNTTEKSSSTRKSSSTAKSRTRRAWKRPSLLSSLPERFATAYDSIESSGLSEAEAEALKARIVEAAKKRKEKGSLYFTSPMSKEQLFTFEGACTMMDGLFVYKMNGEELALARELSSKVGVNILQGKESTGEAIAKEETKIKAKGAYSYLMETEDAFLPYLALAKVFGTFDIEKLAALCREGRKFDEKSLGDYIEQTNIFSLAKVWLTMFLSCYNFLAERDYKKLTDFAKGAVTKAIVTAYQERAAGITMPKLAKLLNVPLKLMEKLCEGADYETEAIKKSSRLTSDMFQMLVNRDKSQQGQDSLMDRIEAIKEDEEFCNTIKSNLEKAKAKGKKGGPVALATLNSRDILALSPLAQTVFTSFLEDIGKAGTGFNGELKYDSLTSLANRCGVSEPDRNYNTSLAKALNELWKASLEYTIKENGKQYLVKFRILSQVKKEKENTNGGTSQAFTVTISEPFRERFFQLMNEKGNFFYSNGKIANVTRFYLEGKCNEFRPEAKQTSTVKKEIPPYTLALLAVLERQKDTANGDIGENKLLRRVGLYSYIEQRKPNEAKWRLKEAIEAAIAGGYIKGYSTKSSSTEGEDIIYNFKF